MPQRYLFRKEGFVLLFVENFYIWKALVLNQILKFLFLGVLEQMYVSLQNISKKVLKQRP